MQEGAKTPYTETPCGRSVTHYGLNNTKAPCFITVFTHGASISSAVGASRCPLESTGSATASCWGPRCFLHGASLRGGTSTH